MEIILKPQEESTNAKFNGQLVMTRNFIDTFGNKAHIIALQSVIKIQKERVSEGADYFQVCEYDGKTFWVIDDENYEDIENNVVAVLMPEDY